MWQYRRSEADGTLRAHLVGLTSRRYGCWHTGLARVHVVTNVHQHLEWIRQTMRLTKDGYH